MPALISMNFEIVAPEEAKVSVMDRSFLYGDSVYEAIRTYGGSGPFLLEEHYDRLLRSAARIGLEVPFTKEELRKHLQECLCASGIENVYMRVVVSRGTDTRFNLIPQESIQPLVVVFVDPAHSYPENFYSKGIRISLVSIRRNLRSALDPNVKSGNYLNNMMALMEARESGAVDAVMLNVNEDVTEGTTSNVFMVKKGKVITPPVKSGLLEGISRALLKRVMQENQIEFEEREIPKTEFLSADEVFLTGTTKDVMPVTKIDEEDVSDGQVGKMTRKLMKLYRAEVQAINANEEVS